MYGPSVPHLQGKTVCHKVQHMDPVILPKIPKVILDRYNNITLYFNIIHINGTVFLNNISQHILFIG